jgi:hypothetical protein
MQQLNFYLLHLFFMKMAHYLFPLLALWPLVSGACISSGDQSTINNALAAGGAGAIVQLCTNSLITITDQITFNAENQEISTAGYPTDSSRATIQVAPGNTVSSLIYGVGFSGIRILNIQIDGNRLITGHQVDGGANIEIGGDVTGQVVSHVASRNPRVWSCLHAIGSGIATSPCRNVTITNNDIGPCGQEGTDASGNGLWADGISLDCTESLVQGNTVSSRLSYHYQSQTHIVIHRSRVAPMAELSYSVHPVAPSPGIPSSHLRLT